MPHMACLNCLYLGTAIAVQRVAEDIQEIAGQQKENGLDKGELP